MELDEFKEKPHDLNELLQLIIEKTDAFTNAERTIIYLYDEHEETLWNRAGEGVEFMALEFALGKGVPGQALEKGKFINIPNVAEDDRYDIKLDDVSDVPVKSMLCCPILGKDSKKIGVIQLINKKEGDGGFTEKDVAFVESMCAQAAIGIDNTLLFGRLQEIRKREQALAEKIKEQNEKLQEAYLQVEEENKEVKESSQRTNKTRLIATIGIIILIGLLGVYFWRSGIVGSTKTLKTPTEEAPKLVDKEGNPINTFTLKPQFLSHPLTLKGELEPVEIENLFAPFTGTILTTNYTIGETVKEGQTLMTISTSGIESSYRDAQVKEINAREEYEKRKNWATSKELADAKRQLIKAQTDLDTSKKLLSLGIISQQNYDQTEESLRTAKEKLDAVKKEGSPEKVKIAEFKWKNALLEVQSLKKKMDSAEIKAEIDGIALEPQNAKKDQGPIEPGMEIKEGTVFLSVADLSSLKILGRVDESDISTVKLGQEVKIFGDAFPGITLEGKVVYISSQGVSRGRSTYFPIKVETDPLTPQQREKIRLGMTSNLKIQTYTNPEALLVPFSVVKLTKQGAFVYRIKPGATEPEKVAVQTGVTTPSSVELKSGVKAGDQLVILTPQNS